MILLAEKFCRLIKTAGGKSYGIQRAINGTEKTERLVTGTAWGKDRCDEADRIKMGDGSFP